MKTIYAREPLESSIFLAGPTPRDQNTKSWRPEALEILNDWAFKGTVFVPEDRSSITKFNYDDQIAWEWWALEQATVIAFWVPRDLTTMPAFTTNIEFGQYVRTGRTLLGYPSGAPKMSYLDALATRFRVPIYNDLEDLLVAAIRRSDNENVENGPS